MKSLNLYTWITRRSFRKLGEKSPTFPGTLLSTNTLLNRLPISDTVLDQIRMKISEIVRLKYRNFDPAKTLFKRIQIQTQTGCNLSCPFCPCNKKGVELPKGKMQISLFMKIMEELAVLRFHGVIHLYLQNEPLLDHRLEKFIKVSKKLCPEASLVIETNGTLLNPERLRSLVDSGIDIVYVNNYIPNRPNYSGTYNHQDDILQRLEPMERDFWYIKHLIVNQKPWDVDLTNRAGNVPWSQIPDSPITAFCLRPYDQIYIGYDGRVILCCQDWKFEEVMGNVSQQSLWEIWNNVKYCNVRRMLFQRSRNRFVCKKCDFQGWP